MSLITQIKAGSVSSLSDARYFAGVGVDWIGFNVDPTSNSYVNPELYKNIVGWVSGPKRVIELGDNFAEGDYERILHEYLPDYLELDLNQIGKVSIDARVFIKANSASLNLSLLEKHSNKIEFLVLNVEGDLFEKADLIKRISESVKILLNISPDFQSVKKIIDELPISGFALQGSVEQKTGLKVYDYSELLETLEEGF